MRPEVQNRVDASAKSTVVDLSNLKINDEEIREIMQKVEPFQSNVTVINLNGNNLSDIGAIILTEYLHDFHKMTGLNIQFNSIGVDGAISIFTLKKEFPNLDILFHGNKIYDVGQMAEIEERALSTRTGKEC